MTTVEQLNKVYFTEEWWQSHSETPAGITNYHQGMLDKGNIITYIKDGELLGYVEVWFINFEQFGRLICGDTFIAPFEDTQNGNIAYLANCWIKEEYRRSQVTNLLKIQFFRKCSHCDYFVGEALRKRTQPIKVFKKSELVSRLFKEGV